ncbi:hypothetical protein AB0P37_08470 [Streptomyces antimycoticus]|uniref:hypothetical protein n=1 Tax=Streptomyces antimycoticus TaxID=68175 RepID=UPI0034474CA5
MAQRKFPSLDGLDAGERPVLGIRERAELENVRFLHEEDEWEYEDEDEPISLEELLEGPEGFSLI